MLGHCRFNKSLVYKKNTLRFATVPLNGKWAREKKLNLKRTKIIKKIIKIKTFTSLSTA